MARTLRVAQFKRLVGNRWTASEAAFIDLSEWDRCVHSNARPLLSAPNLEVWAELDISLVHDQIALVVVARDGDLVRLRVVVGKFPISVLAVRIHSAPPTSPARRDFRCHLLRTVPARSAHPKGTEEMAWSHQIGESAELSRRLPLGRTVGGDALGHGEDWL